MKRVTSQPSGSTKSSTAGPTPAAAARRLASLSTRRSIPSKEVCAPAIRSTNDWPSTSILKLWLVMPPDSGVTFAWRPGQMRSAAAEASIPGMLAVLE